MKSLLTSPDFVSELQGQDTSVAEHFYPYSRRAFGSSRRVRENPFAAGRELESIEGFLVGDALAP